MKRYGEDIAQQTLAQVRAAGRRARKVGLSEPILTLARASRFTGEEMARHEAAHVVVALASGGAVWLAYNVPVSLAGRTICDGAALVTFPASRGRPAKMATLSVAGTVAVPGSFSPTDLLVLLQNCRATAAGAAEALFVLSAARATRLLLRYETAVTCVAEALTARGILDRAQILRLLRGVWPTLTKRPLTLEERRWAKKVGVAVMVNKIRETTGLAARRAA